MLKSLHVSNFKAFGDEAQEIPLRPITLIFGPNSGGKSSAIHSLLLAHHLINTGEADVHRTELGGDAVDLGGFQRYVHRRAPENRIRLELGYDIDELPLDLLERWAIDFSIWDYGEGPYANPLEAPIRGTTEDSFVSIALEIGQRLREKQQVREEVHSDSDKVVLPTGELDPEGDANLLGVELRVDEELLLRLRRGTDNPHLPGFFSIQQFKSEHSIVQRAIDQRYNGRLGDFLKSEMDAGAFSGTDREVRQAANLARRVRDFGPDGLFPDPEIGANVEQSYFYEEWEPEFGDHFDEWNARFTWTKPDADTETRLDLRYFFIKLIDHYVDRAATLAEKSLNRLTYLGPLRSYPARRPQNDRKKDAEWYAGGGYAWELLRDDEEVRKRVNRWLGSEEGRLQTPYEIRPRRFLSDELLTQKLPERIATSMKQLLAKVLGKKIDLGVSGLDNLSQLVQRSADSLFQDIDQAIPELQQIVSSSVDAEEIVQKWIQEMTDQSDGLHDIFLVDQRTRTPVSHRDVGIGISQLLPVLTYAYAYEEKLIALEQPELHLHPAVQAELGDLFIETALGEQDNQFIIETHSEHLILRLLRRIRETTSDELDDERLSLTPEDVAVLYAEPTRSGTEIHNLRITPNGKFANRWPDGFFTEREKELF